MIRNGVYDLLIKMMETVLRIAAESNNSKIQFIMLHGDIIISKLHLITPNGAGGFLYTFSLSPGDGRSERSAILFIMLDIGAVALSINVYNICLTRQPRCAGLR